MIFRGWGSVIAAVRRHGVLLVFILLVASMFVTTSTFGTYQNLRNVLSQNSIIGIIACGMTFAIILGGFDLSVGSMTALASVVGATLMIDLGAPGIPIGIAGAVAVCLLVGATNGWLIAYLGVNPFVATLGTMHVSTQSSNSAALIGPSKVLAAVRPRRRRPAIKVTVL